MNLSMISRTITAAAAVALLPLGAAQAHASPTITKPGIVRACPAARPGTMECAALVRTNVHGGLGVRGKSAGLTLPAGYGPADLRVAYHLSASGGRGQTVAIVDAYDDPNAEADLAVYRKTYGLPACTTANGCFTKVNEHGKTSPLPAANAQWAVEISLDLDMVSAACPNCKILLTEGTTNGIADLGTAVNSAVRLHARIVSNSYLGPEVPALIHASYYNHPGVAILAAAGDGGYQPPGMPATLSTVIAVGGTTLTPAHNARGWTESAWGSWQEGAGTGSGCSAWVAKPSWQHDKLCPNRMINDVSADADPATGLAVYDTDGGAPGWAVVGGTSAATPFVAGVIALAGNAAKFTDGASYIYAHATSGDLNDVVTGTNSIGVGCEGTYFCVAKKGYDGPTGLGTPDGTGAF
jgi:subtilase family serine protease